MAMNLITRKLSQQPIGTHIEVTSVPCGGVWEKITGVITDSDFTSGIEITQPDGSKQILDYETIKGMQITKSLRDVLAELTSGTSVRLSYGAGEARTPNRSGVVTDNDGTETLSLTLAGGTQLFLQYDMIQSLLVAGREKEESTGKQIPIPEGKTEKSNLHDREPVYQIRSADHELGELLNALPKDLKKLLGSAWDSFRYGVKVNDREKMANAARQARQLLLRAGENAPVPPEAALLCGGMLRRVNVYDSRVFLLGGCYREAALAAYRQEDWVNVGVCAMQALADPELEEDYVEDMVTLCAASMIRGEDASGLRLLARHLPGGRKTCLTRLIREGFACRGIPMPPEEAQQLEKLEKLYPAREIRNQAEERLPQEQAQAAEKNQAAPILGYISRLSWANCTGTITADGEDHSFRYQDITDRELAKTVAGYISADLNGKIHWVTFRPVNGKAAGITGAKAPLEQARQLMLDASAGSYHAAAQLCLLSLDVDRTRECLCELLKAGMESFRITKEQECLTLALEEWERRQEQYSGDWWLLKSAARGYFYLEAYDKTMTCTDRLLQLSTYPEHYKLSYLSQYVWACRREYKQTGDAALLKNLIARANEWEQLYLNKYPQDEPSGKNYFNVVRRRFKAYCALDQLEQAQQDFALLERLNGVTPTLEELMRQTRQRLAPPPAPEPVAQPAPIREEKQEELPVPQMKPRQEDISLEDVPPYEDAEGWDALGLTKKAVVDYALNLSGDQRTGTLLAYLRAASALEPGITPVYRVAALAANDPMEAPDYSITALVDALARSDSDYPALNDCCLGAAFLRSSFLAGRGYDYSAQGLRDSIAVTAQIPALREALDTLEVFRKETDQAMDIYADYRNLGVKKLQEEQEQLARQAEELYTRLVLNPIREGKSQARMIETKKLLFAREGTLAQLLKAVMQRDARLLEEQREHFVESYLGGQPLYSAKRISMQQVDALINESWELAGNAVLVSRVSSNIQGNLRSNLRSCVAELLGMVCRWYSLAEQSAGASWRTEVGESSYQRLRTRLMEQLQRLHSHCLQEQETCPDSGRRTGLFLLGQTAEELRARLEGSWKFGQEKFLYADFLRTGFVTLTEDFLPELGSTFCVLPGFNILARIRAHAEGEKLSLQQRVDQIYGMDKSCNDYGTADRIREYLAFLGQEDTVTFPEKPERFLAQTELQIDMRIRSFRETYALAMNYGQIIKSDDFCFRLEDTVTYWYAFCRRSRNYGFLTTVLTRAREQIHACARQYEQQLDEQLDALIRGNRPRFDAHPGYADAIRTQIAQQNFIVAEDWMHRIRLGDFSLDVRQPEALGYLDRFWTAYVSIHSRVADSGRSLSALLGRREVHNKDTKWAQQLIDNWPSSRSNTEKIRQTVNILGWQDVTVTQYPYTSELYQVKRKADAHRAAPQHPIAAFGSGLDRHPMYVACLYGAYDCDRLYEKIRALDSIDGSKIILLDYALGQADRRALAKKLKKRESGLRNVYMVIDRVLITFLANNYNENLINRILMATTMPFSYCQPYVVESVHTMPPEIFIGRQEELLKIKEPDGVNLIYGGRQLGKSALFKKALADVDGREGKRAVLIDIRKRGCAEAARKLSAKLIDMGITPDAMVTDDWDELCRNIERRLRSREEEISYFLLMLDEADTFIDDCGNYDYRPLAALKDIQESLPGRFKFVLAGLHSIVRFNRQVALGNNSVITHMPSLKITPFRTPEAQELLTYPLSYLGISLPSKVTVSQILATVNYFPGLIQLYCQKLIESFRAEDYAGYDVSKTPPYVVTDEQLRRIMADREFVDQIREKFEITLMLDQDQGSCYYPLTLLIGWMYSMAPSKEGYTPADVLSHARDLAIAPLMELDEEKISALMLELQDLNILRNVSGNAFLLASKNFRDLLGSDEEIADKLTNLGKAA